MKNKLAAWIALGLIAVVAAGLLATTNEVTKGVIEEQNVAAMQNAWVELVPGATFPEGIAAAESEEGVPAEYTYTGEADGGPVGYVAQTVVQGYGGDIEVIVGTDTEGVINGIRVGGANFKETAGLGAKSKEPAFTDQFIGKTVPLTVGENIDAITASTITSNAVVRGVNTAVENIAAVAGFTIETPTAEAGAIGDGRYAASTKGFAGPVYVEMQLDADNVITEIIIGDDQFAETAGYGQKAQEPAFYEQFIGKTGQLELGTDIDAIAGATITSKAVVDAVNTAMLYATDPEAAAAAAAGAASFELPEVPENALTESASSKGFEGPVAATITVDPETRELLRVEFGDDMWAETDGIGTRIHDEDFWHQFIGKTLPVNEDDIDLLSGATYTSKAAFEAVNKAYFKLYPDEAPAQAEPTVTPAPAPAGDGNTATASAKGFEGPVAATITVDENNAITAVTFGDDNFVETKGVGTLILEDDFAAQFIGKTLPLVDGDIDVISGSTISSKAAIEAVNKAFAKLAPAEETAAPTTEAAGDGNTATASAKGFEGPVAATITVDENNAITAVTFGDDNFVETKGVGTLILEDDFAAQFIGKTLPLADGDIDVISGSTISSKAAIEAVNKAFAKLAPAEETAAPTTEAAGDGNTATASSKGFEGPVAATITVDENNAITAVTFGDDNFVETKGVGTLILEDDFAAQFIGKTLPLADGDIDVISGSTISSKAAIEAVNKAFAKLAPAEETVVETKEPAASTTEAAGDGNTATASSKGFEGPVAATITVDENNAITAVTFGDDNFVETKGVGTLILEDDFAAQFIGKTLPLADGDIDVISGSTISSKAAIEAVNKAFAKLAPADDTASETPEPATEEPTDEPQGRTTGGRSDGYTGPVYVQITLDDTEDVLTGLVIGDLTFADFEGEGLGAGVLEPEFAEQFIGKTLPLEPGDIDVIAGATVTSEAVVDAVNKAYRVLVPLDIPGRKAIASVQGYQSPVAALITVDFDADILLDVRFGNDKFDETQGLGTAIFAETFKEQFINKNLPLAEGDIDLIASATITSQAAVDAVNAAFEKVAKGETLETASATVDGPNSAITATLTVDQFNEVMDLVITQEQDGKATNQMRDLDDFSAQYIGKIMPVEGGDVDQVSGATLSSRAAIKAVEDAYLAILENRCEAEQGGDVRESTASSKGFEGPVAVTIGVDANGVITALTVGDDNFAETQGIGTQVREEQFTSQFIGKTLPLAEGDIDTISGATVSSTAVIEAVNKAYDKLLAQ